MQQSLLIALAVVVILIFLGLFKFYIGARGGANADGIHVGGGFYSAAVFPEMGNSSSEGYASATKYGTINPAVYYKEVPQMQPAVEGYMTGTQKRSAPVGKPTGLFSNVETRGITGQGPHYQWQIAQSAATSEGGIYGDYLPAIVETEGAMA